MQIVYLIMAHNNSLQLKKLVEKLDYKNNSFVIHFDLNGSEIEYNILQEMFGNKKNVFFSKRNKCYWGDISLVDATIECLKAAYQNDITFDYAVLISGQHYPIMKNEQIENHLVNANNNNFMSYFKIPAKEWANENGGIDRIIYYHFNKHPRKRFSKKRIMYKGFSRLLKKLGVSRKPVLDINKFYGGSQWWCLTNESCAYILSFVKTRVDVYDYFKHVLIPDEIFFQTILLNSKFKDKIINNNLTYMDWGIGPATSPITLDETHYDELKKSKNLWARKFDTVKSEKLIKLLDCETKNK
ncbi:MULTISPECIES: beta-1,6-N-acetylglucosaminyltransferase [Bacillaceae]|uniref:beta-1,6-N-acetylglucosaminyltransferase n=1 Tax=Bacillaceae TaxID=186817 RepID=UPI000660A653|nr:MULTISPECIES: beta-1,6-N-acetylglucosaminyltransferase [Bacillaceae]MCF7623648.1 beta-1,6-N-acetylglucosaminyltransferase [Peribacillus frigoritolerans]